MDTKKINFFNFPRRFLNWHPAKIMFSLTPMKNLRLIISTVVLLTALSFSASAQTKLATVDMQKLFKNYWKTKSATASLDNREKELAKEMKDLNDSLDKAQADYKQLVDQSADPAISAEERDKRKQAAADKAKEINTTTTTIKQFQAQARSQLADESQRMSSNLRTEIQKAVGDKAKAAGYTLVLNSADSEIMSVVYADPQLDITDAVLAQLNAGAPIDLTKPAPPLNVSTNLP